MKRVLVTGGYGFIGSHVVEAYLLEGYEVIVIDNLSSGIESNLASCIDDPHLTVYRADIKNKEDVESIIETCKPHIINHHAAQKSIPHSMEDPINDISENLIGLMNLIMACKKHPIDNFIFVSSGGALSKELIGNEKSREDNKPQLESPYAITKYSGENYVRIYAALYGFNYVILRYGNAYGPRQIKDGECGVIPIFVDNIVRNQPSTLMTYDDMPRGCTRDYINVADIAQFNVLVAEKELNTTFNVSSGTEIAILDLYQKIQEIFSSSCEIEIIGPRLGDVKRSVLDVSKAKNLVSWETTVSLDEGLEVLKRQYES